MLDQSAMSWPHLRFPTCSGYFFEIFAILLRGQYSWRMKHYCRSQKSEIFTKRRGLLSRLCSSSYDLLLSPLLNVTIRKKVIRKFTTRKSSWTCHFYSERNTFQFFTEKCLFFHKILWLCLHLKVCARHLTTNIECDLCINL